MDIVTTNHIFNREKDCRKKLLVSKGLSWMVEEKDTVWREQLHRHELIQEEDILEKYGIDSVTDVSELKKDDFRVLETLRLKSFLLMKIKRWSSTGAFVLSIWMCVCVCVRGGEWEGFWRGLLHLCNQNRTVCTHTALYVLTEYLKKKDS